MREQFNYVLMNHWVGFHNKFVNSSEHLVNNVIIVRFRRTEATASKTEAYTIEKLHRPSSPIFYRYLDLALCLCAARLLFCSRTCSFAHTPSVFKFRKCDNRSEKKTPHEHTQREMEREIDEINGWYEHTHPQIYI